MTSKQRAYLKGLSAKEESILSIGKEGVTPGITEAAIEALNKRELIKITVLKNCFEDKNEIANVIAERTHSTIVQVIGRKIVLYKEGKDKNKKIVLPS